MTLVLGGGVGGLSAAYYLLKTAPNKKVILSEAKSSLGGWIRTVKDPKTGVIFEKGPRTLRVRGEPGANTLSLLEELGLSSKIKPITIKHPSSQNRLIYVNGSLHLLPSSFSALFKKTPPFSKPIIASVFKDIFSKPKIASDDSVYSFVERRFGHQMADYLISAMICGICAGDARQISVKLLMPQLFDWEQKYGSMTKGFVKDLMNRKKTGDGSKLTSGESELLKRAKEEKWTIFGMEGGLSCLTDTLHKAVSEKGARILLNSPASELNFTENGVTCKVGNEIIQVPHVVSSLPAAKLAPLLEKQHPKLAELLSGIPYVTVAVVNFAFKGRQLDSRPAFGFLVPPSQEMSILGVVFDSCTIDQGDWTVLTVMMGGAWFEQRLGRNPSEEALLNTALSETKRILGLKGEPESYHVDVLKNCIAQYIVGHEERIGKIWEYLKANRLPMSLVGSSYKGIGANDVMLSARRVVEELNSAS